MRDAFALIERVVRVSPPGHWQLPSEECQHGSSSFSLASPAAKAAALGGAFEEIGLSHGE